jgi:protein-S-isoprenylcysteine O-methyltransferase Ste14
VDAVTTAWFSGTTGAWALFEASLLVRDRVRGKGSTDHDARTRILIRATLYVAIAVGVVAPTAVPSLRISDHDWITRAGLLVMWLGLVIRVWAVASYRWVRHPCYTGLLVFVAGFGLGLGNWLSLAIPRGTRGPVTSRPRTRIITARESPQCTRCAGSPD